MTRSSTSELFTPYQNLERQFRSSIRLLKTLSLDELRSPGFNLFSEFEYSKEEEEEPMAETIEQYMSKTRADYRSGVVMPKIKEKDNPYHIVLNQEPQSLLKFNTNCSITTWEYLKAKFLSKYCPPSRTAKKMEEINNFQQEPDENLCQAWERFKELLMKCPQYYLTEMQEVVLFYNGLDVPTRQILDSRGAIPSMTAADAKKPSKKWLNTLKNGTMEHLEEEVLRLLTGTSSFRAILNNLGKGD
ncbi:retrovirus-related pol polyprotein from transposon TNT 1-94 [Tanacetum coccineum]|uniref:Retrovirus-related pol polyprotein from transposon TNT 1-94 n=1 Tax=Tanacetum coccineum TaxID=301880 RepID=A0ABQ5GFM4_9ASTR